MAFSDVKYEADSGQIYRIRLSEEKLAVAGAEPSGAVTSPLFVKISKTNREFGIRPRYVGLAREVGTAPDTFNKYAVLPVLTPTDFNSPTYALEEIVLIDGISWEIISRNGEDF